MATQLHGIPVHPSADEILGALDPEQREVAAHPLGPMCVLAGAGTGKTRAITHRIAYGVHSGAYQPQRVLAVTFTARAAGEMRTRLRSLAVGGVQARTFHAAALRQLHFFWPQAVGGAAPEVMSQKASAVAQAAASLRLDLARDRTAIRDLAAEVEWAKVSMLTPETYAAGARAARREPPGLDATAMARVLEAYEQVKTQRGVIDFEDVLLLTVGILAERDDIARAVRAQYRHFVVDEYQDVNALQQRLLDLWVGERQDVCVVGDPAQTIYSFTGASPRHLLGFTERHRDARVVRLVRNYRSTPQIVSLANLIVRGPSGALRGNAVQLQAQAEQGPVPALTAHPDDPAEAAAIAAEIAERVAQGVSPAEIAVLFRTNGQSEAFESALADRGIPYLVRGGERFFSRPRGPRCRAADAGCGPLRRRQHRAPRPGARRAARRGLDPRGPDLGRRHPRALGVPRGSRGALGRPGGGQPRRAAARLRPRAGRARLRPARPCGAGRHPGLAARRQGPGVGRRVPRRVLRRLPADRHGRHARGDRGGAAADLCRRHPRPARAAAVVGRRPHAGRPPDPSPVALPRRGGEHPRRGRAVRSPRAAAGGRRGGKALKPALPAHCRGCGTELTTAAQRKTGRCADCPPAYDEATFERLRAWRLAVAREASVPAYVVFTDATLTAIAEREPKSDGELAQISGVGVRKLGLYGTQVLAILGGAEVDEVLEMRSAATRSES